MNRKRMLRVLLITAIVLAVGLIVWDQVRTRTAPAPGFTDLNTALKPVQAQGWELSVPPKRGGPYRLLPGGSASESNPAQGLNRVRDSSGAVVEEINLPSVEGRDQTIAYLETADGHVTMAVLTRPR